jgi:outer membrane protein assembly factor BamB
LEIDLPNETITDLVEIVRDAPTGFTTLSALAFAPDGTLFAMDALRGLGVLDPLTGVFADVNSVPTSGFVSPITFDDGGVLYGYGDGLYVIDTATGDLTLVGDPAISQMRGLAFYSVPEPTGWFFCLAAGIVLTLWQRKWSIK